MRKLKKLTDRQIRYRLFRIADEMCAGSTPRGVYLRNVMNNKQVGDREMLMLAALGIWAGPAWDDLDLDDPGLAARRLRDAYRIVRAARHVSAPSIRNAPRAALFFICEAGRA